jgi:hypothetical protein
MDDKPETAEAAPAVSVAEWLSFIPLIGAVMSGSGTKGLEALLARGLGIFVYPESTNGEDGISKAVTWTIRILNTHPVGVYLVGWSSNATVSQAGRMGLSSGFDPQPPASFLIPAGRDLSIMLEARLDPRQPAYFEPDLRFIRLDDATIITDKTKLTIVANVR